MSDDRPYGCHRSSPTANITTPTTQSTPPCFQAARYHDHWAIYQDDVWTSRDAEGFELSPSIKLIRTPGHSAEDITTLAHTGDGVAAFTHVWWNGEGPAEDPYAEMEQLHASRARVLAVADVAIPGHGPAFVPSTTTPR